MKKDRIEMLLEDILSILKPVVEEINILKRELDAENTTNLEETYQDSTGNPSTESPNSPLKN